MWLSETKHGKWRLVHPEIGIPSNCKQRNTVSAYLKQLHSAYLAYSAIWPAFSLRPPSTLPLDTTMWHTLYIWLTSTSNKRHNYRESSMKPPLKSQHFEMSPSSPFYSKGEFSVLIHPECAIASSWPQILYQCCMQGASMHPGMHKFQNDPK